jgi:adenylate kinase
MALNVIMLGPPGAGKGTQADRFARGRGIPKISTGDILREAVQAGTDMGRRVKAVMDKGELVSDELIIGIVRDRLDRNDARPGFVLDGFPRTVAQASALDGIMQGRDPLIIVNIAVPDTELVRRLGSRLVCEDCGTNAPAGATPSAEARCSRCGGRMVQRSDDNEGTIRERLRVYHRDTAPLVDYYRKRPTFRGIDGAQAPDAVANAIDAAVEAVGAAGGGAGR